MKKIFVNYGGVIIFYIVVILGVLSLCTPRSNVRNTNFKFNTLTGVSK